MEIRLSAIDNDPRKVCGDDPPELLELDDEEVKLESNLRYDLEAYIAGSDLVVQGRIEAEVKFNCFRCSVPFTTTVVENDYTSVTKVLPDVQSVNLTEDIRESIILAFPTKPLCGVGCKGLCSRCGTNLNEGSCSCEGEPEVNRWGALDGLELN